MIKLNPDDLKILESHAVREYPKECCGVIIGDINDPSRNEIHPCKNIQHELKEKYPDEYLRDADTGYFIDPKDLIKAFNVASKRKVEVIGFYHSHPDHDAYWSAEDHRAAMWAGGDEPSYPDAFHIVISVRDRSVKQIEAFAWDEEEKQFNKVDIAS